MNQKTINFRAQKKIFAVYFCILPWFNRYRARTDLKSRLLEAVSICLKSYCDARRWQLELPKSFFVSIRLSKKIRV